MNKLKHTMKNFSQQSKHCNILSDKQTFIKLFYCNQMHYNYELDENEVDSKKRTPHRK